MGGAIEASDHALKSRAAALAAAVAAVEHARERERANERRRWPSGARSFS